MTGRAINLVSVNSDGKMEVSADATACLRNIKEKVAVVSVLGRFRGGKSSLLARLIGRKSFEVSHSVQACTKGIRLYDPPLDIPGGRKLILLDTEGLMATDSDTTHDTRVFALGILLSSAFVYNVTGTIDETTLSTLRVVTQFASMMLSETSEDGQLNYDDLAQHMPEFNMLVRDFALKLESSDGHEITPTQWLEEALSTDELESKSQQLDNFNDKVEIRRVLKKLFTSRKCYTLPRPTSDEDVLAHMDTACDKDLKPAFVQGVNHMRKELIDGAPSKTILGESVTGEGLLAITHQLVDRINSGTIPRIRDSWVLLAELRARDAAEQAMQHMRKVTATWGNADMSLVNLRRALDKVSAETLAIYKNASPEENAVEILQKLEREDIPARVEEVLEIATQRIVSDISSQIAKTASQLEKLELCVQNALSSSDAAVMLMDIWAQVKCLIEKDTEAIQSLSEGLYGAQSEMTAGHWKSIFFQKVQAAVQSITTQLVQFIETDGGSLKSNQQIKDLETLLNEAKEAQEKTEADTQAAIERIRQDSETEMECRMREARESRMAERDDFQTQLQRINDEHSASIQEVTSLRSEIITLKRDLESAQAEISSSKVTPEDDLHQLEVLKGQIDDVNKRAERAEKDANELRDERVNAKLELQSALEAAKNHTDAVIASHEQEATRRISEAEIAKENAETAADQDRKMLEKVQRESQQMVANLTARLETAKGEVDSQRRQLEEGRLRERDMRREEHQAIQKLQDQLSETRRQHQSDVDKREGEWQRLFTSQMETKVDLERRIAQLAGLNDNGKRELERLSEVVQENKRLRHGIEELRHSQSQTDAESKVYKDRLSNKEKELDSMATRLSQSSNELSKVNTQLAVEKYKNDMTMPANVKK